MKYAFILIATALLFAACTPTTQQPLLPETPNNNTQPAPGWLLSTGECNPDARPEFCTLEYNPVCGDDGETYGNACAACASETVDTFEAGECGQELPRQVPERLDAYCDPDNRPEVCTREYNPVCGSDGTTHSNPCVACSNDEVDGYYVGACEEQELAAPKQCDPDNRPDVCTREYNPVCGDDGETYGNACEACASDSVLEYQEGACDARTLPEENQTVCTMDAKLCPDGSYVGRQGPNCEFAPCPSE